MIWLLSLTHISALWTISALAEPSALWRHEQCDKMSRLECLFVCCRIIGAGNKNLNKIVEIFVKVLGHGTELAEAETADQMVVLLTQMQGSLPPQVLPTSHSMTTTIKNCCDGCWCHIVTATSSLAIPDGGAVDTDARLSASSGTACCSNCGTVKFKASMQCLLMSFCHC